MFVKENPGFFKNILLKLITVVQKRMLKMDAFYDSLAQLDEDSVSAAIAQFGFRMYYRLAKLHFKLYFGKDLVQEILNNTEEAHLAVKRHGRLVVKTLYKDSADMKKKMIRHAARGSFRKNLILDTPL